jgi:hypothetical protein
MNKVLVIFIPLLLLIGCNVQPSNNAPDITVGNVMILTNGNSYEPLRRMAHALRDGISASGEPLDIDSIANDLVPIYLGDDFQIIVEGKHQDQVTTVTSRRYTIWNLKDGSWVRTVLIPSDAGYELMDPIYSESLEKFYTDSFINLLERGEYILIFTEHWGNTDEYIIYDYFTKIVIG